MKKPKLSKKVNIRDFQRNIYRHLNKKPLVVYNKRTGEIMFVVISEKKGGEIYELPPKDTLQPKRKDS